MSPRHSTFSTVLLALAQAALCGAAGAQVPTAELLQQPANATHFIIESTGGKHGDSWSWVAADGTRMARESMNLRGQVWEMDYRGTAGQDGMPALLDIRGVTPTGDAAETFAVSQGTARWKSPVDHGSAPVKGAEFYATLGGPLDTSAWLLERLLASPAHRMRLLPGGAAHAVKMTSLTVGGSGAKPLRIDMWAVFGIGSSPVPMWADAHGKFFALTSGIGWLPEQYAGEQAIWRLRNPLHWRRRES